MNSMFIWCRDHRLHHRYSDTDADPHNSKRGFFFSHVGWLMCKKHPYVIEFGKKINISDLQADWMVMFQKKNQQPVESWIVSFFTSGEGWHNYHHAFPWDYKAAELSTHLNPTARIIEFLASIGMIYDLKSAPPDMVKNRIMRTGDGTHYELGNEEAKAAVKVSYPPLHPMNPTYTVTYEDPVISLKVERDTSKIISTN
ncbi:unnamed protein product [Diatraea saccharalis]|uniref:Uncharacterized protein n=1 Tax=Diatraea saccharalis TaxID=40085 RepID=A0A9N9R0V8_9NEOP|nr:unnamed protein product [Diatraea saccharalis]